ncbi:hypothetical protein GCM10022225_77300 [Plantactinospora mayteni]|uniref:Putative glycogen debranching enzyme N-terminal domain-containing protein n=1 Tax=Plantactinospora mayteni TaxID=566021 RepID=A0ABQ4F2M7_9ACTN|nr:hypothetical protein Pma05_77350 [Plantactinospora mayteni]
MRERIELESYAEEPVSVQLRLAVGTDFADLFEIKETVRDRVHQVDLADILMEAFRERRGFIRGRPAAPATRTRSSSGFRCSPGSSRCR